MSKFNVTIINTDTGKILARPYARLGRWADVTAKMHEALRAGAVVTQDEVAGTVSASLGNEYLFRAMLKEAQQDIWLVLYSSNFYPRPS